MGFYSETKKNVTLSFLSEWMELEKINISEVSQTWKAKNYMVSLICGLYN
jgi:hypothetical protein